MVKVIKKDGTLQPFDFNKVLNAVNKSSKRVMVTFTEDELHALRECVITDVNSETNWEKTDDQCAYITVPTMHNIVEKALESVSPSVAKSYRDYRNYKTSFVDMIDSVYKKAQAIMYIGDKENANSDSTLVSTKRCLIFNEFNKELYQKFFMRTDMLQACRDGYIYCHDMSARRDTMNCCLSDVGAIMEGGFEMGNIWYNEPKTLDTAFDVLGDIILSMASQQYGGYTVSRVDEVLEKYAEKSYKNYKEEYIDIKGDDVGAHDYAMKKVKRDFEQGFQGIEHKLNTVASSRGDYPFTTFSFGVGTSEFAKMATKAILKVRKNGQGATGKKKSVLFPKLVFTYTEDLHGPGKELEELFIDAIDCSSKSMYPDYLSLDGDTTVAEMWHKYGEIVAPMGCRAFLSPYYERGGMYPADENDKPFFTGRFNIGVVSLNLPMIYMKSKQECKDFYEVLDYFLQMIRELHIMTYEYLGQMKASTNPLAYCQGGFHDGHLDLHDNIKPLLKYATASFGITALNELNRLHNGKSIREDGEFPLEVMRYINNKLDVFKKEDGNLYAIYGTPAENLCSLQVSQFRKKYGIIENVSDREYVSNSFHCHVSEEMDGIEKQDKEYRFWNLFQGGRIQYVRYDINYNKEAIISYVRRAMKMGFYEGVNFTLCYCDDCGKEGIGFEKCPNCGSINFTRIERMNG